MKLVLEVAGWSNPPSHPRRDAPRCQPLGGMAQGAGTRLKAWEKSILLVDAHMRPLGAALSFRGKAPVAWESPSWSQED